MIPKILFQTWKSKSNIPDDFSYWSETFREENPQYMYRLWDDADNRAFITKHYSWFLERYDSFPAEIYRADAIRYFFLYTFGGIYADMDVECLRSLDPLLDLEDGIILGSMGPDLNFTHSIPNALMVSRPREEFWLLMMSLMMKPPQTIANERPEYRTGPVLLKTAYQMYTSEYRGDTVQNRLGKIRSLLTAQQTPNKEKSRIRVMAGNVFFPLDWNDKVHDHFIRKPVVKGGTPLDRSTARALFPKSFTVTYWSHSWEKQNDE